MDGYRCAYRDPHSPLTPLEPMRSSFDFNDIEKPYSHKKVTLEVPFAKNSAKKLKLSNNFGRNQSNSMPVTTHTIYKKEILTKSSEHKSGSTVVKKCLITESSSPFLKVKKIQITTKTPEKTTISTKFKQTHSPILPKQLCRKVEKVLTDIGMKKYLKVFEKEEIDYSVFKLLSENDLRSIGVQNKFDRDVIMNAIHNYSSFY